MNKDHSNKQYSSYATPLAQAARYLPLQNGRYQITAGLSRLGTDFGNGDADHRIFQIDHNYHQYRDEKLKAREQQLDKYVRTSEPSAESVKTLTLFLVQQLNKEYPELFQLDNCSDNKLSLHCLLSGETLLLSPEGTLEGVDGPEPVNPPYASALDALACQIQEDLAVLERIPEQGNRLTALHLCFPNHWSADDKIGNSFNAIHKPVPGFEKIAARSDQLINSIINNGSFVRFAWGVATDTNLDHHPESPTGRCFDIDDPALYLRVERQTMTGLGSADASLFTIRTYFVALQALQSQPEQLAQVRDAIQSMSRDTLLYKGLLKDRDVIIEWIDSLLATPEK